MTRKGSWIQEENWEWRDRCEPVVRSKLQKCRKEDIIDGVREEGVRVWLEATRSAFKVSSKTVKVGSAGIADGVPQASIPVAREHLSFLCMPIGCTMEFKAGGLKSKTRLCVPVLPLTTSTPLNTA